MAYLNVTDDLPVDVEVGQMLKFDFEGSPVLLQIMKKEKGQVYAKRLDPAKYLTPEEADEKVWVEQKTKNKR